MKVYWLSRHDLSPAQMAAIRDLHGEDVEVVKDSVVFSTTEGLADYIREHEDGFVYAVASAVHYLVAALAGLGFGFFENHPGKRQDGTFGLAAVYHLERWFELDYLDKLYCRDAGEQPLSRSGPYIAPPESICQIRKVWVNPDPMRDKGEVLTPVVW